MEKEVSLLLIAIVFTIVIVIIVPYLDVSMGLNGQLAINFFGSFFGVLISILFAFSIQALFESKQEKKRIETENKRQIDESLDILKALKDEINHNIELLKQMIRELPTIVIFYNLQLSTWNSISITKLEALKNFSLVKEVSRIYYEYEHLSRKVDIQFQMHYGPIRIPNLNLIYEDIRNSIIKPILMHANILIEDSKKLIEKIDKELSKYQQN